MTQRVLLILLLAVLLFTVPVVSLAADTGSAEAEEALPYADIRSALPQVRGESKRIILSFIGDCTLGCKEIDHGKKKSIDYYIQQYGFEYPFAMVRYILAQDDLTVANMEGIFQNSVEGLNKKTKKEYNFRADESYADIFLKGSVEAVTVGNNHIGDYGQSGFDSSIRTLKEYGIKWFGSTNYGGQAYIYEKDGVKIGFVGSYISYYWQNVDVLKPLFDELREEGCAAIIAVIHGGVEYAKRHDKNQYNMARKFINWGADIVVGHHPHCLQGYEIIEGAPVYYSIGNFVFAGNFSLRTNYTVILSMALSFDEEGRFMGSTANLIPCRLSQTTDVRDKNLYQPYPVTGKEAQQAIKQLQYDTKKPYFLKDYQEGVGALQEFVPAIIRQ